MTGIAWLDGTAAAAFAVVTVLALVRLGRARGLQRFLDDAFHTVMGVAMTAMFWPGGDGSVAAWIAVAGLIVVWPLLVLALATRQGRHRRAGAGAADQSPDHVSLAHTGYWLTCTLLMVVAVGAGHGSAMPATAGSAHPMAGSSPADTLAAIAAWPVWPVVGVGFLLHAGFLLLARRPITERACAAVMAAGMALMAFTLS